MWRKVLTDKLIYLNFNYWPLIWMLFSAKSIANWKSSRKSSLFILNNYDSPYEELLENSGKSTLTRHSHVMGFFVLGNQNIQADSEVKMLGVHTYHKLDFNLL